MWLALRRRATGGVAVAGVDLLGDVVLAKGLQASESVLYTSALTWILRSMGWVRT